MTSSNDEQTTVEYGAHDRITMFVWRWFGRALKLGERVNLLILAAFAVVALSGYFIAELADTALEGDARQIDEAILLAFRASGDLHDPIGSVAIEEAVRDVTALGGMLLTSAATLFACGYYLVARRARTALFVFLSVIVGVGLVFALKFGIARPRPDVVPHSMEALSPSFPSGHAATAAVVYLTLAGLIASSMPQRRLGGYIVANAVLLVVVVGISRVYLGVHWPTDVLAGWSFGASWAFAAWLIKRDFQKRGWLEPGYTLVSRDASG